MADATTATTTAGGTTVSAADTPTWYDQLAGQFGNTISGALNNVNNLGTTGWYKQPLVAGFDPLQQQGFTAAAGTPGQWQGQYQTGQNTMAGAQPLWGQAGNLAGQMSSGLAGGQGVMGQGQQALGQGIQGTMAASQFNPNSVNQFMNPYLQQSANALTQQSNQNLFEKVLPGVNSTFAGQGQFGSTRNADFTNRAIRDQQQNLTNSLGQLNYGAMNNAQQQALNWGQLGTQGAANIGSMGAQMGQLGQNMAALPSNIYGAQASQLGNIAGGLSSLGAQQGQYGLSGQQQRWQDVQGLMGTGQVGQQNQQQAMTAAYQDWMSRLTTPMGQLGALTQMLPQISQLYQQNRTTVNAPTGGGSMSSMDYLLPMLLAGAGLGSTTPK